MKHMMRSIVFLLVALAMPVIYGGQPAPGAGVAGVDVIVKQRPSDRAVTDARGNFAIEALAAGSYTLTFRARKAEDLHHHISDKVIIATSYSIKIDGTKRAVNINGLVSDDLLAGYDIDVALGPGARIRGQVAAGALKNMVWIPKEPGSNIPGHWAAEDSAEAKAAPHHHAEQISVAELRKMQR
jgi:Carboxypeptidase regulatory-like domain